MAEITQELSGALADRYLIEKHIGEGGMATVYLARDLRHDRLVALKVLRPELAAVIGADRFLNEIKVTANLQHPHILPLHDSGDASGFLFYVMPYIEGDTLRDKLDRERQLGIEDALAITKSIASALDYAHRQGVIHRDIKPANILMHDGQALVADFGIALAVTQASDQRLTETGLSIGTPHYMSPEQAVGDREVDARSDIYSLAAMLYEMLAGEPPYGGSTAQAILAKILTAKAAPVSAERDTIPPHIDAAIAKALNRHPADRFPTAAAFVEALGNPGFTGAMIATGVAPLAAAAPPVQSRVTAGVAGAAALAVVALAFFGGRATTPERAPVQLTRFVVSLPESLSLGGVPFGPALALSADGEWLAFVVPGGGPVYRRRLGQLEAEPVPGTEGASIPFFSPDSRWLGFFADGRLRKVSMAGGPAVPITEASNPTGAAWGDNDVIAFVELEGGELFTVPGSGGEATPVGGPSEGVVYNYPSMLPGGEAALMVVRASAPEDVRVVVVDLQSGVADTLAYGTHAAYASGHLIYSGADGTLLARPFDPGGRRTNGQEIAILDGLARDGPGLGEFAISQGGGLAYQAGAGSPGEALVVTGPEGDADVPLPQQGNLEDPAFSPDGRRIAMRFVNVGESQDIWIWDRDRGTLDRLTVEGSVNSNPVWTPDGTRVAFASVRESEPPQLYWQAADGSGAAERLIETDLAAFPHAWSPNGQTLAFTRSSAGNRNQDIGLLTTGDSLPRWVVRSEFNETQPQISPNGLWLAYTSDRSGALEVYVQAASGEGSRFQVSTDGGHSPRWAPGGDVLYYAVGVAPRTLVAATISLDGGLRVGSREPLFSMGDLNTNGSVNYDVSPDGLEFVHISQGSSDQRSLVWILNWPEIVREMKNAP